jgi:hypothetical protein
MNKNEVHYQLISTLLQAGGPSTFTEPLVECGFAEKEIPLVLKEFVNENPVVGGELVYGKPSPQYCWRALAERGATPCGETQAEAPSACSSACIPT